MLDSMRLQLRRSEISERLAALSGKTEALTDDEVQERSKLTDEFQTTEAAYRKAVADEAIEETEHAAGSQAGDGEAREIRTLQQRASLSRYIQFARSRTAVDGAERELNEALDIEDQGPGTFPLQLLAPDPAPALQQRADAATNLGAVATSVTPRPWIQRLFLDDSFMGFLGPCFAMDSQASGTALYTRITGGTTAGTPARGAQQDAAAMTLETVEIDPEVVSAGYLCDIRDKARFGAAQLDAALRTDLRMVLREKIGDIVLSGNAAPKIQGLLDTTKVTTATSISVSAAKEFTYKNLLSELAKLLDGKHASGPGDLKLLWSRNATTALLSVLAVAETGLTQWAGLNTQGYAQRTEDRLTAMLGSGANLGLVARTGAPQSFRSTVWRSAMLTVDNLSLAPKGQERITLTALFGCAFPRPTGFALLKAAA